jgi:molybdopterin-biosynthesis enzyme MoeA-like protein
MKRKIEDMTLKLEKADDDKKTLKDSLKRTEDDNQRVKILLEKAITTATRSESSLEESMKNIKDLREKLKRNDTLLKDVTISRDIALRDQSKNYQAYQNANKKNKDLERRLQNATTKVQDLEASLEKAEDKFMKFQRSLQNVGDKKELAAALQRLQKSEDDILKTEEENLNLLRSLKRAQELLSHSSTFIKEIGGAGESRIYSGEVKRDRDTKDYKNESERKDLLVERFQELNGILVESDILEHAIYDGFVDAFKSAIKELCTPKLLIQRGPRRLYRIYEKKVNILESDLAKAYNRIMNAYSIFHTIDPMTHPQLQNFEDFDLQIYREIENIVMIFEGIEQERTLSVNSLPGYGIIVFWELTRAERARIEKKKPHAG